MENLCKRYENLFNTIKEEVSDKILLEDFIIADNYFTSIKVNNNFSKITNDKQFYSNLNTMLTNIENELKNYNLDNIYKMLIEFITEIDTNTDLIKDGRLHGDRLLVLYRDIRNYFYKSINDKKGLTTKNSIITFSYKNWNIFKTFIYYIIIQKRSVLFGERTVMNLIQYVFNVLSHEQFENIKNISNNGIILENAINTYLEMAANEFNKKIKFNFKTFLSLSKEPDLTIIETCLLRLKPIFI